ncbi:hypothetical protein KQ945_02865 [Bacillus subtilis subsp. subtilis]|nr:hypothetical protein [Bacillus subtilis subsp. subtilis]
MRGMRQCGAVVVVLALWGAVAQAAAVTPLAGTYSNVCQHADSGDLLGTTLFFPGAADPGHVQRQRYEGAALAPERLALTARGAAWYVLGDDGAAVMVLRREGAALRVTYLDGQQADIGGDSETLVASARRPAAGSVPVCR